MAAWSKVIESREEIPTVYKSTFDTFFANDRTFPRVLLTPALDRFPRKTTEKLVIGTDEDLHILERNRNQIQASCYPYRDIWAVELGVVLLNSWLTIRGKTSQGEAGVSTIQFNTTGMRHFEPILKKLRPSPRRMDQAQIAAEKDKFDCLSMTNFKFMNYGRESLIPGEVVLQFLLQPEIRQPLWTIFGRTFCKTLSPAHLTILTDRELILIRNPERVKEAGADRYGGIWQFLPLHSLQSVTLSQAGDERLAVWIRHPGQTVETLFEASNQPALEQLCSRVQTLIGRRDITVWN